MNYDTCLLLKVRNNIMCLKTVNSSWRQPISSLCPHIFFSFHSIFSLTTGTLLFILHFLHFCQQNWPCHTLDPPFSNPYFLKQLILSLFIRSLFLFKCLLKFQIASSQKMLDLSMSGFQKRNWTTPRFCD